MRYSRVLLVNPNIPESYLGSVRPSPALGYLAEILQLKDIEHDVLDMTLGHDFEDLIRKVEDFEPDLVGFSLFTFKHKNAYELINSLKNLRPNLDIVVGGPHVSTLRNEVLRQCQAIDLGVTLEGENTLLELCQGYDLSSIKGLIYRNGNEISYNGDRSFVTNLDELPFPQYEKFELDKYMLKEILILSSRGCPHNCIYCAAKLVSGKQLRIRSAADVVSEIEYWHGKGYRRFNFGDDNFTFYSNRVYEFCDELERRGLKGLDLRCGNGVRADKVDKSLLKRMREVGFRYIAFGVEGGNDKILKQIKKGEKIATIKQAIKDACELGYDVTLFFLIGSPGETWADFEDSIRIAKEFPVLDVRFYNLIPYPHTELYDWVETNGYFIRQPSEYLNDASVFINEPIFQTPELSLEDRKRALEKAEELRRRVLRTGMEKRLQKFGILGKLVARVSSSEWGLRVLRHNKTVRSIAEFVRGKF